MAPRHAIRRCEYCSTALAATAATTVPRTALGGCYHVAPNDKITVAYIGCGPQELRHETP